MKKLIIILTTISFANIGLSQVKSDSTATAKHTVFLELIGNGLFGSVNYDYLFIAQKKFKSSTRVGAILIPRSGGSIFTSALVEVSLLLDIHHGTRKHYFELGLGLTYNFANDICSGCANVGENEYYSTLYNVIRLGYRLQKVSGGLFLKFGFTPFIPLYNFNKKPPPYMADAVSD